jgi:hypothetical protein
MSFVEYNNPYDFRIPETIYDSYIIVLLFTEAIHIFKHLSNALEIIFKNVTITDFKHKFTKCHLKNVHLSTRRLAECKVEQIKRKEGKRDEGCMTGTLI